MRSISIEEFQTHRSLCLRKKKATKKTHANFEVSFIYSFRQDSHGIRRLELALVAASDDDVVDLEHHAAQLGGEQELLAPGDERVDDEGGLHVCSRMG